MTALARVPLGWRIAVGLATLYLLWGSTFLGIRIAVETLPPLWAAGLRWMFAGGLLYAVVRPAGGAPWSSWARSGAYATLLVAVSNGGVTWSETRVPSGIAALGIATVTPWLVVLDAARPNGRRPSLGTLIGVAIGVAGVAVLADPRSNVDPLAMAVLLTSAFAFALGTTFARLYPEEGSPMAASARQMLLGGTWLVAGALVRGEPFPTSPSAASLGAIAALAVLGSLAGYSLFGWLLRNAPPALVGTYACVNPVVALTLGAVAGGEQISARATAAAALVVLGVALVSWSEAHGGTWTTRPRAGIAGQGGRDGADGHAGGLVGGSGSAAAEAR